MIAPILALIAAASAASPVDDKPYLMQKASDVMVSYAVKYRQTGVPEIQASSAAAEIVNSVLAQPQATEFVRSAASYLAQNGPSVDGSNALKAASKASSFYDQVATKPAYTKFAVSVAEKTPLFDLNRAFNDAENQLNKVSEKHTDRAGKAVIKANAVYQSVAADPNGAKAIQTGKQLASRVAKDFKVDTQKVKAKVGSAKTNFLTNLFSR